MVLSVGVNNCTFHLAFKAITFSSTQLLSGLAVTYHCQLMASYAFGCQIGILYVYF